MTRKLHFELLMTSLVVLAEAYYCEMEFKVEKTQ